MRRGNNKSVQEKLSDSVSLESGSGMSAPRIGDRNARSHAPSAGAAQPALTRPWLTAFLASSPPPVCCLSVQTKSSRPHPDTFRPPPTRRLHRLASPSVSTASDHTRSCIMVSIQPNQRLHSNATTLTSDFPSTCHSSPNLLPLSCVLLHHRPLNNPRAFRPSSRPKRRPPRSSRRRALVCSHLALVQSPGPILTRASPLPFYRPHSEAQGRTQRGSKEIEQLKANKEKEFADFQKQVSYASHRPLPRFILTFFSVLLLRLIAMPARGIHQLVPDQRRQRPKRGSANSTRRLKPTATRSSPSSSIASST